MPAEPAADVYVLLSEKHKDTLALAAARSDHPKRQYRLRDSTLFRMVATLRRRCPRKKPEHLLCR